MSHWKPLQDEPAEFDAWLRTYAVPAEVDGMDKQDATNFRAMVLAAYEARNAEIARLKGAISWALGETEGLIFAPRSDEPRWPDGEPMARYWWRGMLRRIAGM